MNSGIEFIVVLVLATTATVLGQETCPDDYIYNPCTCKTYSGVPDLWLECVHDNITLVYDVIDKLPAGTKIAKIIISSCPTTHLRPRIFGNLTVSTAWFSVSHVTSAQFPSTIFDGQEHSLTSIFLFYSGLNTIPTESIKKLENLKSFTMMNSDGVKYVPNAMSRMSSTKTLRKLVLTANDISKIENGALQQMEYLEELWLDGNPLSVLNPSALPTSWSYLNKVVFTGDKFTELPTYLLKALHPGAIINFDDNKINDVTKNDITMIIKKQFKIHLQGNPLNCTCDFLDIAKANEQRLPGMRFGTCKYPLSRASKTLDSLRSSDFQSDCHSI